MKTRSRRSGHNINELELGWMIPSQKNRNRQIDREWRGKGQGREKTNALLTPSMKVYPTDIPCNLVEADVIKPFKARSRYLAYSMIGNEE